MNRQSHSLGSDFHVGNRQRLTDMMDDNALAIVFANDEMHRNGDQNYPYRQQSDLYYLTGINQEQTVLIMFPAHPNLSRSEMLFIRESSPLIETWEGHKLTPDEARDISGVKSVFYLSELWGMIREAMQACGTVLLNANEYPKYHNEVQDRQTRYGNEIRENYPTHQYARLAPMLATLRKIKQDAEIDLIRKAVAITGKAFDRVLEMVRPGVYEYQVQAAIEYEFTFNGSSGPAYAPIVAAGKNALCLHYIENRAQCDDGDLLLMDFGCELGNYASDMSRTIPVNGTFTKRQRELFNGILSVFYEAKNMFVPGNSIDMVNEKVNELMEEAIFSFGLGKGVDRSDSEAVNAMRLTYFPHGTSHFIGLDVHDVGMKSDLFKPGMVLTCEPGIYIREEGIGIRIENDILVTENGAEDLMEGIATELEEIEGKMRGNI